MKRFGFVLLLSFAFAAFSAAAFAAPPVVPEYGTVDVQRIYSLSRPGRAAAARVEEVRQVLQKGMDDLLAVYAGREDTPEARADIARNQQLLNQQMQVERQKIYAVMDTELRAAVAAWRNRSPKNLLVIPAALALGWSDAVDVTPGVMNEMNRRNPTFPDLPTVTLNREVAERIAGQNQENQ